jgi:hypothetical protein
MMKIANRLQETAYRRRIMNANSRKTDSTSSGKADPGEPDSQDAAVPAPQPLRRPRRILRPIGRWKSEILGMLYKYEETETALRQSGIVPEWVNYPKRVGSGSIAPKPNYLDLYRLKNGRIQLWISAEMVMARDTAFRQFLGMLLADKDLSLVKGESI